MFAKISRLFRRFSRKSRTVNNEPLNAVSLTVIILVDLFILVNVFSGLHDIGNWYIFPTEAHPCYAEWNDYRSNDSHETKGDARDYAIAISDFNLQQDNFKPPSLATRYQENAQGHLGTVSKTCVQYAQIKDKLTTPENIRTKKSIDQKQTKIAELEQTNQKILKQYDSTLLEKLAGQPPEQSINLVPAGQAKQDLERNTQQIKQLQGQIGTQKNKLLQKSEFRAYLTLLNNQTVFQGLEQKYDHDQFWYSSISFGFQGLFLLPLLAIATLIHRWALTKGYGLLALISWHLLIIFLIPLLLKFFEFLQVGVIFNFVFNLVSRLLGNLLFLVSYLYILIIPPLGYGIIKFCQRMVFNPKIQAAARIQHSKCIQCAKILRKGDDHCPHCGYYQYIDCQSCHQLTYKYLPHCKQCGAPQMIETIEP